MGNRLIGEPLKPSDRQIHKYHTARMLAVAVSMTVLICSCGVSGILHADFKRYDGLPAGSDLEGPLPGTPEGDLAGFVLVPTAVIIAPPGKVLRIGGRIDFFTKAHETPDTYFVEWKGHRDLLNNTAFQITLLDGAGHPGIILQYGGVDSGSLNVIRLLTGDDPEPAPIPFSVPSNAFATIKVTIHMAGGGSIDVSYQEPGQEQPILRTNLHFRDQEFAQFGFHRIRFAVSPLGAGTVSYYLSDLVAFAKSEQ